MAKKRKAKAVQGGGAPTEAAASPTRRRGAVREGAEVAVPAWAPTAVYALLTLLLFGAFVFSNRMLFGSDTLGLGYMARKFYADAVRAGDFPLWNPLLLGGAPFLEALSGGDSLYPSALLLFVMEPFRALGWKLVVHVFLAGLFMYGWTRRLGVSRAAALVAGTAYLLAPYFVTLAWPGHDGKMFVTALTPLLFWAMEATFTRGLLAYVGVAAVVALVILTTHFQMAYFLFGAAGVYYAFRCVQEAWPDGEAAVPDAAEPDAVADGRRAARTGPALSRFALFLAASLLGAAAAGIQLLPAVEYATQFSRRTATTTAATPEANKEYAATYSLHPEELAAMVVPEFVGNDSGGADWTTGTYWGRNAIKYNHEYVGLVVLLLAGVSFCGARRRALRLFLTVLGVLALLYAMGAHTPVWHIAYAVLPGIRLFRAASMVVFLFGFAAATLAAFGVDRLLELHAGADEAAATRVLRFLWITAGVVALGLVLSAGGALGSIWSGVVYPGMDAAKAAALAADQPFIQRGFVVAFVLALGTAGLVWAALRGRLPAIGLVGGLALLITVDLWRVDAPFIEVFDPAQLPNLTQPDPIVQELLRLKATEPPFRVFTVGADQDVGPATFGLALAGGHHPNDLARYRDLIGMEGSGSGANLGNPNILRLLAIRYLVWPTAQQGGEPPGFEVVARTSLPDGQPYQSLLRYPALPRARLVGAAEVVPDAGVVARVVAPDFDPAITAVLAEPAPLDLPGGPVQGSVEWVEDGSDRIRLTVDSPSNALLVVADNWYPAWKASVNGAEVPILRAYHTLRAVPVGPGRMDVVLWYDAGFLRAGILSTAVAGSALVALAVVLFARDRRRGRPDVA
jgi:hypothetical protein